MIKLQALKIPIAIAIVLLSTTALGQTPEEAIREIESMSWMTEQYPPFNFLDEKGVLKGITVEILHEIFRKLGIDKSAVTLTVLPWPRSYKYLLEKPGTALFSTTYTVERLQHFKFVGPIIPTQVSLIAPKNKNLDIKSVADMNRIRIGAIRDDIGHQLLRTLGVSEDSIILINSPESMVRMLDSARVDAIAYAEDIAKYQIRLANFDLKHYGTVYVLQKSHMGYAFHKATDPRVLEPLRKALDELRADGTVDRIYSKYVE